MSSSTLITDYLGEGTHAARPATPSIPTGGLAIYYETDTGNTFAYDKAGAAWHQLNGTGTTSYFGTGAPSTLHNEGDLYFDTSTTPYTLYVQHSSAWHSIGGGGSGGGQLFPITNAPVSATFTQTLGTPSSKTDISTVGVLFDGGAWALSDNLVGYGVTVPATPYTVTLGMNYYPRPNAYNIGGIFLSDGTKIVSFGYGAQRAGTGEAPALKFDHWTNNTTFSAEQYAKYAADPKVLRIVNDGTNITAYASMDGYAFTPIYQEAAGAFCTITKAGFFIGKSFDGSSPTGTAQALITYWTCA